MNPEFPIYVISKGRWESRLTVKAFERMRVPFQIVIEPQEFEKYAAVIDSSKILILPFSNLGEGSIPARNWVWKYSSSIGAKRHWIVDDNINGFVRLNRNQKIPVATGTIFKVMEEFVGRYENIALAGPQYRFEGGTHRDLAPPFYLNSRVYSCILVRNDLPYRWRGRYNEDTDLNLRALKDGWCTILFHAFLQNKSATMRMSGGNTDELYVGDGRLKMAQSLQEQHPDIVKITRKWGRWQHQVDYSGFKNNKLIFKEGIIIPEGINEYGMILKEETEAA